MKKRLLILPVVLYLAASHQPAQATVYVSNLGDLWTQGGIGDIHGLFAGGTPYGSDTARFTTGAGSYSLNAITLEFEFDSGYPAGAAAPQWVSIQLFQGSSLLGSFGNPRVDPTPTQWPQSSNPSAYTQFIDFSPLELITLNPLTEYSIVASMPANSPVVAALLFTRSSAYDSVEGWAMGTTTTGNPYAVGERLVMAVEASLVPEPNTAALTLGGFLVLMGGWKSLRKRTNQKS
jgi:hypothetical protein